MSKAIMISINPKHVANILNYKKTVELRKNYPYDYLHKKCFEAYTVYIYCTKGGEMIYNCGNKGCIVSGIKNYNPQYSLNGKVVGSFHLVNITPVSPLSGGFWTKDLCITEEEMLKYLNGDKGYLWHIENLEIFNKPKELSEFRKPSTFSLEQLREFGLPYTKEMYKDMTTKGKWFITRAPQSWCYVEEL